MKKDLILEKFPFVLLLPVFTACIQTVELGSLPYEEKLVIHAVLRAGEPAQQIYFTRTFGFDEPYSVQKAAVRDVVGSIVCDGISYPLGYSQQLIRNNVLTGFATYEASGLTLAAGKTYTITADWNGHRLQARTTIPDSAIVDTIYLERTTAQLFALFEIVTRISSRAGAAYTANYELQGFTYSLFDRTGDLVKLGNDGETIDLRLRMNSIDTTGSANSLYVNVFSFAGEFYNYYRTRNNNRVQGEFSLIFSGAPGPVHWNVEGEALGLFIGMNKSRRKVISQ